MRGETYLSEKHAADSDSLQTLAGNLGILMVFTNLNLKVCAFDICQATPVTSAVVAAFLALHGVIVHNLSSHCFERGVVNAAFWLDRCLSNS